jgi:hypothetical protein
MNSVSTNTGKNCKQIKHLLHLRLLKVGSIFQAKNVSQLNLSLLRLVPSFIITTYRAPRNLTDSKLIDGVSVTILIHLPILW